METQISATVGMDSYLCLTLFFFSSAARILDTCGELIHGIYGAFFLFAYPWHSGMSHSYDYSCSLWKG